MSAPVLTDIITPEEDDFPYEEDLLRNPYYLKSWIRYLDFKTGAQPKVRNWIYERALKHLPGSYKLWHHYLRERRNQVDGKIITDPAFESVNNVFERAMIYMNKMPRIWIDYLNFMIQQCKITRTRMLFDRALKSLPITQHNRIWPMYIKWIKSIDVPETAIRVFRRYLKLEPGKAEEYVDYLISAERFDEAAVQLTKIIDNDAFVSTSGKTKHQYWLQLCELISTHATSIKSLKVDPIIRTGIRKFTDNAAKLWVSLAEYYIRLNQFEKARDIFEEGINTVMTVRDFTQIWDAYTQFEDSLITKKMESMQIDEKPDGQDEEEEDEIDFDLRVARYEHLLDRQPLLVNSVLLRQNPHNVNEWHKRVSLYGENLKAVVDTYTKALLTVDPHKATGKPHTLWVNFGKFYEQHGQLDNARKIFEKAVTGTFRSVDDLASVWCQYAEMELRHNNYETARNILQRATVSPRNINKKKEERREGPVQSRLYKSTKIWAFLADLEESIGTFMTCKAVYEKILDLRIATPQLILNFARFLEENKHFEEAFKAYEKGIALFDFPQVMEIWVTYLSKFIARYAGKKLERARELFDQAVEKVPPQQAKLLYLMYANVEEQYGLARHAMSIYDKACTVLPPEERYHMFMMYIQRAAEYFGVTRTREIFEKAIESLPDKYIKDLCLKYADMEKKLGEIDRARAIYVHASQFCDPKSALGFWKTWNDFEVKHGNEDTFREMLRIKRSAQAQFSTQINFMAAEMLNATKSTEGEDKQTGVKRRPEDAMASLDAIHPVGPAPKYNPSRNKEEESLEMLARMGENPEEINIQEEGEEEGPVDAVELKQLSVPQSVFGSITEESNLGAKARIKGNK